MHEKHYREDATSRVLKESTLSQRREDQMWWPVHGWSMPPEWEGKSPHLHPAPRKGGPNPPFFLAGWQVSLLLLSGDVERDPGPGRRWQCALCSQHMKTKSQTSICCNHTTMHWVHITCTNITQTQYTNPWKCALHTIHAAPAQHTHSTNTTNQPLTISTQTTNATTDSTPGTPPWDQSPPVGTPQTTPQPSSTATYQPILSTPQTAPATSAPTPATPQTDNHLTSIDNYLTSIDNYLTSIDNYLTSIDNHLTSIDNHLTSIDNHLTSIDNHLTSIDNHLTSIDNHLTSIDNHLTSIDNHLTSIDNHLTSIDNHLTSIDNHLTSIDNHLTSIDNHLTSIDNHLTSIDNHLTSIDNHLKSIDKHLTSIDKHLITGDISAHSHQWHSPTEDHHGSLIADIIANSNQITLNTNTPTRIPPHANQQPPDITTITNTLQRNTDWTTIQALSSDHLPILITYKTKTNYKIQQHRTTYTNYNKANWQEFTQEIEQTLADTETPQNAYTATKILTNAILAADKHHIPKGKIHHTQTTARTHKKHDKTAQHNKTTKPQRPTSNTTKCKHRQRNTKPQTSTLETTPNKQLGPQNKHPQTLENNKWSSTQKTSTNAQHHHHL